MRSCRAAPYMARNKSCADKSIGRESVRSTLLFFIGKCSRLIKIVQDNVKNEGYDRKMKSIQDAQNRKNVEKKVTKKKRQAKKLSTFGVT